MNKSEFQRKLKEKKIDECVEILREELIVIVTKKLKEKRPYFVFSTTSDLYKAAQIELDGIYVKTAFQLQNFDLMEETEEYELSEMMNLYKEITEETNNN